MSKDTRNVLRAPRIHGRLVTDEDEIKQLLSPEQGQRLLDSGALSGGWEFEGDGVEPPMKNPFAATAPVAAPPSPAPQMPLTIPAPKK